MRTRWRLIPMAAGAALLAALSACDAGAEPIPEPPPPSASASAPVRGEPATWMLPPGDRPQPGATAFTALVTRLDCNNGVTGQVLDPVVQPGESTIVVTFSVAPAEPGAAPCQGNNAVPHVVQLGEPLQGRSLTDGQCLEGGRGVQVCGDRPTRFEP